MTHCWQVLVQISSKAGLAMIRYMAKLAQIASMVRLVMIRSMVAQGMTVSSVIKGMTSSILMQVMTKLMADGGVTACHMQTRSKPLLLICKLVLRWPNLAQIALLPLSISLAQPIMIRSLLQMPKPQCQAAMAMMLCRTRSYHLSI